MPATSSTPDFPTPTLPADNPSPSATSASNPKVVSTSSLTSTKSTSTLPRQQTPSPLISVRVSSTVVYENFLRAYPPKMNSRINQSAFGGTLSSN